jgi:hypothetical protein
MVRASVISFVIVSTLVACSVWGPSGTNTAPSDGGTDSDTDPTHPGGPHPNCSGYLECVAAASPESLSSAMGTYGPDGACWGDAGKTATICEKACKAARDKLSEAFPDVAECSAPPPGDSGASEIAHYDVHCRLAAFPAEFGGSRFVGETDRGPNGVKITLTPLRNGATQFTDTTGKPVETSTSAIGTNGAYSVSAGDLSFPSQFAGAELTIKDATLDGFLVDPAAFCGEIGGTITLPGQQDRDLSDKGDVCLFKRVTKVTGALPTKVPASGDFHCP